MTLIVQRNLSGGEIAPALYSRADFAKYGTALRVQRNCLTKKHGGIQNRPGFQFIGEVKDSTDTVRLFEFVFNSSQTYVLEFGDLYMRVIKNGAYITDLTLTITGITNASVGVVTYTGTDPVNGEEVYISGVVGAMANYVNGRNFKIANVDSGANTFELQTMDGVNFNTTAIGSYASGGTAARIYTLTSPFAQADLFELRHVQSADVITFTHPGYVPRELTRSGDASWAFASITFGTSQAAPTSPSILDGGVASTYTAPSFGLLGTVYSRYKITAVSSGGEESVPVDLVVTGAFVPGASDPFLIGWTGASGAASYNVYREVPDGSGFIGSTSISNISDPATPVDFTKQPPSNRSFANASGEYPIAVTYYQQRLVFGGSTDEPETVWASRSGFFKNLNLSSPITDASPVTFTLAGREVNEIRHLIDIGKLVILTASGEFIANGNDAGALTPTGISVTQHSNHGSASIRPLVIDNSALFIQARGKYVRDLAFDFQADGYKGNDVSIYASHLFEEYSLVDWAFQKIPHSIVWAVRSDGTLLALTYVKEQGIMAWHKHDLAGGKVKSVACVPEGTEDVLYAVVEREIDSRTVKYVEKISTRYPTEDFYDETIAKNYITDKVAYYKFMDSHLSYDGRNTNTSNTMTLSGGTDWDEEETLTLTASASLFASTDVGKQVHISNAAGDIVRFSIEAYSSATVVTGKADRTVVAALRSTATYVWSIAVNEVNGLWHLEGEDVSVFADGFVEASPNNASYTTVTVTNGSISLSQHYGVIHAGLPYLSDIETLDLETLQSESMLDKDKNVNFVAMHVEETRGVFAGPKAPSSDSTDPLEGLEELQIRGEAAETYDQPVALTTDVVDITTQSQWNNHGRVFIRQVDPIPMSINSVGRSGLIPIGGR